MNKDQSVKIEIDAATLWRLRPTRLPGRVVRFSGRVSIVQIAIPIYYPNNQEISEVGCVNVNSLKVGDKVLFSLKPADEGIRRDNSQRDLMEVDEVYPSSDEEYEATIQQWDRLRVEKLEAKIVERYENLVQAEAELDQKQANLDNIIEDKVLERLQTRNAELDAYNEELRQKDQGLNERQEQLELLEEEHKLRQAKFEQLGGKRFLKLFGTGQLEGCEDTPITAAEETPLPDDVINSIDEMLRQHNYSVEHPDITDTLLAICVAAITGQFVVLAGPPGSGKTSLVERLAGCIGAGYDIVPVRPAWIDPTDLLGFYDPHIERFRPTPFLDRIIKAAEYSAVNLLFCLTLDEMNLGRIENYAADLMSQLEKARTGKATAALDLYALEMKERLLAEQKKWRAKILADSDEAIKEEGIQILDSLVKHLDRYPMKMPIPDGLILFGTINSDETTMGLSPKFLDRSLVLQRSLRDLPENILQASSSVCVQSSPWQFSLPKLRKLYSDCEDPYPELQAIWDDVRSWESKYLRALGIHLSHRFCQTFMAYMTIARNLKLQNSYEIASGFFLAKIIPCIHFHEDEVSELDRSTTKDSLLDNWHKDESLNQFPRLRKAIDSVMSRGGLVRRGI